MPLKITHPVNQVAVLNRWADDIEAQIDALSTKKVFAAARQSSAAAASSTGGSGGSGVSSVGLTMPVEFVSPVAGSIGTGDVRLAPAWTSEPANTVFAATPASPSDHVVMGVGANHTNMTLTGAATAVPQLAIFMTGPTATSTPTGFTQVGTLPIFYKLLSDKNPIAPNAGAINNATGWTAVLEFAASNGSAPAVAVGAGFTGSNPGPGFSRVLTPFTPPSGSAIFVYVEADQNVAGFFTSFMKYSCTDDQGNSYAIIADVNNVAATIGSQLMVFVAQNVQNVPTTVTVTQTVGPATTTVNLNIEAVTFTNLQQASPGIPSFQSLQPVQIPLLDASKIASGRIALARGGTNADLSATGGASRFLKQSALGAAITVVQPAFTDISGAATFGQLPLVQTTVGFSATPTFAATGNGSFVITLTGNVTSSTISGGTAGQSVIFIIKQDGAGAHTFVWPTNMKGTGTIAGTINGYNVQPFIYDGTNWLASSAMQSFT